MATRKTPSRDSLEQQDNTVKQSSVSLNDTTDLVDEHARALIESNTLKEGDAKELRQLHTTWTQHIWALENLRHKIDPAFLTSLLQLKLDKQTSVQWKWKSRSQVADPPKVNDLLVFLNDRATTLDLQNSEKNLTRNHVKAKHCLPILILRMLVMWCALMKSIRYTPVKRSRTCHRMRKGPL